MLHQHLSKAAPAPAPAPAPEPVVEQTEDVVEESVEAVAEESVAERRRSGSGCRRGRCDRGGSVEDADATEEDESRFSSVRMKNPALCRIFLSAP